MECRHQGLDCLVCLYLTESFHHPEPDMFVPGLQRQKQVVRPVRTHLTKGFGGSPLDIKVRISECLDEAPEIFLLFHLFDIRGFRVEYIQYFQLHHHTVMIFGEIGGVTTRLSWDGSSMIFRTFFPRKCWSTLFMVSQVRDFVRKVPCMNGKQYRIRHGHQGDHKQRKVAACDCNGH